MDGDPGPGGPMSHWSHGRPGLAINEGQKEWHPPKEALHPSNIESRDRRGFIQLPNFVYSHI
jgi:hypothetical protein